MKKYCFLLLLTIVIGLAGCGGKTGSGHTEGCVAATTKPVALFAGMLLRGTPVQVETVVEESVSCLHDYALSVRQMELLSSADAVLISGAGLEAFMDDALQNARTVVDGSAGVDTLTGKEGADPHYWLDPRRAKTMAAGLAAGLSSVYPQYEAEISANSAELSARLDELTAYGTERLSALNSRGLVTFHDGFAYFADAFGLTVAAAIEQEAGSEIAAAELEKVIDLIRTEKIPAIFTEENGTENAADIVAAETGASKFVLATGLGDTGYFDAMRRNIDTVREALS